MLGVECSPRSVPYQRGVVFFCSIPRRSVTVRVPSALIPITLQCAEAIGAIGDPSSIPELEKYKDEGSGPKASATPSAAPLMHSCHLDPCPHPFLGVLSRKVPNPPCCLMGGREWRESELSGAYLGAPPYCV